MLNTVYVRANIVDVRTFTEWKQGTLKSSQLIVYNTIVHMVSVSETNLDDIAHVEEMDQIYTMCSKGGGFKGCWLYII